MSSVTKQLWERHVVLKSFQVVPIVLYSAHSNTAHVLVQQKP